MTEQLQAAWDRLLIWLNGGPKCPIHNEWPWAYRAFYAETTGEPIPNNCHSCWWEQYDAAEKKREQERAARARKARIQEIAEAITLALNNGACPGLVQAIREAIR